MKWKLRKETHITGEWWCATHPCGMVLYRRDWSQARTMMSLTEKPWTRIKAA